MKAGDRGEGSIHPNGNGWVASRYVHGKRHRKTFATLDEAKKQLKTWRKEVEGERFIGPEKERITVEGLADHRIADLEMRGARSIRTVKAHLKPIREAFGRMRAVDLTTAHFRRFIQGRQEAGREPATINRETQELGAAFNLAIRDNLLSRAPHIPRLDESGNTRQGFFETEGFEAAAALLPEPINDAARFGFLVGWREGEILKLTWDRVNLEAREIRLSPAQTKNREGRVIGYGWHGELAALLERRSKVRAGEYVFCWPAGHRHAGRRVVDLTKPWKKACVDAKVPGRLFHDLRRTAVRNMIRAGVPETVAMAISGHKTRAMLDRYNITSTDDTREALKLVGRYHKAQKAKAKVVRLGEREAATN